MISLSGLTENLLPNLYVKSIDLQTQKVQNSTVENNASSFIGAAPKNDSANVFTNNSKVSTANVSLSVKTLKTTTFSSQVVEFLSSEYSDYIKIYAHQITDSFLYRQLLDSLGTPSTIETLTTDHSKSENPPANLKTQVFSFKDIPSWKAAAEEKNPVISPMTEQYLDDGTILNEAILNLNFDFNKNTDFLAYLFIVGIKTDLQQTSTIVSKPTADVVLINGKLQTTGMMFTISLDQSPFTLEDISNFGKPGEIWTGGVHFHEGRYMAGTKHTSSPHAYLDYQFAPVTKFTDNRSLERLQMNPFSATKELETVNATVNMFKNNLKLSKFSEYKKPSFTSDIYLSQDQKKNVNGVFFIDKMNVIKNNCAFPFIFKNIELALKNDSILKNSMLTTLMLTTELNSLKVHGPMYIGSQVTEKSELANINQSYVDSQQDLSLAKTTSNGSTSKFVIKKMPELFLNNSQQNGSNFDFFTFKHHIGKSLLPSSMLKYSFEVEYKDPTPAFLEDTILKIKKSKKDISSIMSYVDLEFGFDRYSRKIKDNVLAEIKLKFAGLVDASDAEQINIKSVVNLANDEKSYVLFYDQSALDSNSNINNSSFAKQIKDMANLAVTSLDKLNTLVKFLDNMEGTLENALSSISVKKQEKSNTAQANQYGQEKGVGNVQTAKTFRFISDKSAVSKIKINDHGYDFTGYFNRDGDSFQKILTTEYIKQCNTLFSTQFSTLTNDNQFAEEIIESSLQQTFKVKGWGERSAKNEVYSFLNIPTNQVKMKKCVMLPKTVMNKNVSTANLQNMILSIVKYKNNLLQNNSNNKTDNTKNINEDLLTVLENFGASTKAYFLSFEAESGTSTSTEEAVVEAAANNSTNPAGPLQANVSFNAQSDLGSFSEIAQNSVESDILKSTKFKTTPINEKVESENPNYLLLSLLFRKLFTKSAKKRSFKLEITESDFEPINAGEYEKFVELISLGVAPPINVLSLTVQDEQFGPLKNFISEDQGYIKNGVVNPALLAYFWFIHQNIVIVEYLDGFEESAEILQLKTEEENFASVNSSGVSFVEKSRNTKKPIFKPVTNSFLSSVGAGTKLVCRLRQYENSVYTNKKMIKEFKMPLINNYFILEVE